MTPSALYLLILPGLLMAMTGIGVGDLATAGFTGAQLGTTVLWAIIIGALFKYVLTEGIARWQLASGSSVMQGGIQHIKKPFIIFMTLYFIPWCWFVGGALINAAGVAGKEIFYLLGMDVSKFQAGIFHSVLALLLIFFGKPQWFNRLMAALAILLFLTVLGCVFFMPVPLSDILSGFIPNIPPQPEALSWTLALMGGVGGTLTILCYGYWLSQSERSGLSGLKTSRLDILISYSFTALFGIAMVIIGSVAVQSGKGLGLLLSISEYLNQHIYPGLGAVFLVGAWAAIFSSLLGVWQAVPLIFADAIFSLKNKAIKLSQLPNSKPYKLFLWLLALVPILSLQFSFKEMQKLYSLIGAFFMPLLALTLLWLNNRFIEKDFKNGWKSNVALIVVFLFFAGMSVLKLV